MVAVFGIASGRLMMQRMGFGPWITVLLDAAIIRTILVPSTMALLGDRRVSTILSRRLSGITAPLGQ